MEKLNTPRPCICGAPAALIKIGKTWQIGCTDPKCALIVSGFKKSKEAIAAWDLKLLEEQKKQDREKRKNKGGKKHGN